MLPLTPARAGSITYMVTSSAGTCLMLTHDKVVPSHASVSHACGHSVPSVSKMNRGGCPSRSGRVIIWSAGRTYCSASADVMSANRSALCADGREGRSVPPHDAPRSKAQKYWEDCPHPAPFCNRPRVIRVPRLARLISCQTDMSIHTDRRVSVTCRKSGACCRIPVLCDREHHQRGGLCDA